MFEELFASGDSLVHRLDPRVKVLAAFGFSVVTALADKAAPLGLALALALALVAAAKLPLRAVARRLVVVNGFVLMLWLMLPFTYGGEPVFTIGPLAASREGVLYALLITVKSNAIIVACMALLSTTHLADLGRALGRLYVPAKIVHIFLFMLRYLGVVGRQYSRLRTSMKVRLFRPRTDLHTYRSYAGMVGMLLISSFESAEAVYAAMLCRGFSGTFCALDEFELKGGDVFFASTIAAALLLMGLLQWTSLLT
jgi:cobalt/nickel transport system permease protein